MLRYILLDLDDTLYASSTGLWDAIGSRIGLFMVERLGMDPAKAAELRQRYLRSFGTTLNGLRHDFGIDPDDYLEFVHDLPLDVYLQPDPALGGMLARLPLSKAIFTNADRPHAERVLARLDIRRHFDPIVDIRALDFINKPDPRAYERALDLVGAKPEECVFVDDALRNLQPAQALGLVTVLVGPPAAASPDGAHYQIANILQLERVLAGLMGQTW